MKLSRIVTVASAGAAGLLPARAAELGMLGALVHLFPTPVVIAIVLIAIGALLILLAWPIQKWIAKYHHRIRDRAFASARTVRITGWRYDTTLTLFGLLLLALGLLLFVITFPWSDL